MIDGVDLDDTFARTVITVDEFAVDLGDAFAGERAALLNLLMYGELELRKHRLAEEGAPDQFQFLPR
jgi:hypothetical protein